MRSGTKVRGGRWLCVCVASAALVGCKGKDQGRADESPPPTAAKDAANGTASEPTAAKPRTDYFKAVPMEGPFDKLKDFCKGRVDEKAGGRCTAKRPGPRRIEELPPFDKLRLFHISRASGRESLVIGVRTDEGWFMHELPWSRVDEPHSDRTKLRKTRVIDVFPGGAHELEFRSTLFGETKGRDGAPDTRVKRKERRVCGFGPSKRPSCLTLVEAYRAGELDKEPQTDLYFDFEFKQGGVLVVTEESGRKQRWGDGAAPFKKAPGTHMIVFP